MALETGHQPGRCYQDQAGNQFMGGNSFSESGSVITGDGAVETLLPNLQGVVTLTKGSAAAITIANPIAGDDDGKIITVVNESGFAHVVTQGTQGFNGKGASGTITYAATIGAMAWLYARNGKWWVAPATGITIA
jgi:hypothetical protein